LETSGQCE